jgi:hypothetical protein
MRAPVSRPHLYSFPSPGVGAVELIRDGRAEFRRRASYLAAVSSGSAATISGGCAS